MPSSSPQLPDGLVLGLFGPTASGKSAVAEEIARRIPAETVSADSAQLYRGLPILTNQSPAALVAIWELDHEASVAEYQELAHTAIDAALAAGRTPVVVGGTGLYFRAALGGLDVPPAPGRAHANGGRRCTTTKGGAAHGLLAERDPAAAARRAPERPAAGRPGARARRRRSLAHGRRLWAADTRHPTLVVGLDVSRAELARRIDARTRAMFEAGVEDEVRAALAGPLSSTAAKIMGLREVAELPRAEAVEALAQRTRRSPRTSGSGCGGSPASLPCVATGPPTRWRMRFSRWRAAGNEYLLAERAELGGPLTPEQVRADVGEADGILEVVARDGAEAEIVIWNPDGSTAEMSGNGTRIAARWLAERSGADDVRIRVGPREVSARMLPDGEMEQELGPVEVLAQERIAGLEVTAVSVGNPHAVVLGDPDDLPLIGPLLETHPRFPERTNVQVARVDGPGRVTARVWERGGGRDPSSGTSAVAVAAATHGDGEVVVSFPGGDLRVSIEGGRAR